MSTSTKANSPAISEIDPTTKASVLLEALPYIQRFRGSIFVVKYGGSFMDDLPAETRRRVATDLVFLAAVGIQVVVVHGGGKAISRAMAEAGEEARFVQGLRVTGQSQIDLVARVLNTEINAGICALIEGQGGKAQGMPGQSILLCEQYRPRDENGVPVDIGYVGDIRHVKAKLVKKALAEGRIPVISPIAADDRGQLYNTNADVAAAHVAASLRARRLVYLCDVPGLMQVIGDDATLISTLASHEVPGLIAGGVISAGMRPKVESAVRALYQGVKRVHFVDGRRAHTILLEIFTHRGIGTEIVHE